MKKEWFAGLQSLKGILFIMVFLSHCGDFFPSCSLWGGQQSQHFLSFRAS